MTSPIEVVFIKCPKCQQIYDDWYRASINLDLDDFDEDYIDDATSSTCPHCQHKIEHDALIVGKE